MEPENNERLASAIRFLPEAVVLTETRAGLEGIIFANESFEQLTGYTFEELQGRDMTLLSGPATDPVVLDHLLHPVEEEEPQVLELVLYRKDGKAFWDRVSVRRFQPAGAACHVQAHSDITRQKEIENLLVLSQKREAAGHLVSGITHDFNNLLTAIMAYAGLMAAKTGGDSQLTRYIGEIHVAAQRGAQLVDQLLDIERQEAAEPVLLDLGELTQEMHDLMQRVLGEDIRLRIEREGRVAQIKAPQGRLQQVLLNLGINARDAMPAGGDLIIRLANVKLDAPLAAAFPGAAEGDYVLLSVSDSGTGMDAETRANIFKPFFTTKGRGEGSGLGLFTVDTIVRQIGGYIAVESGPDQGTTFRILLPVAAGTEATPAPRATLLMLDAGGPADRSLSALLSAKGYRVLFANSIDEALRIANSYPGVIEAMIAGPPGAGLRGPHQAADISKVRPMMKVLFHSGEAVDSSMGSISPRPVGLLKKAVTPADLVRRIEELLNQPSML